MRALYVLILSLLTFSTVYAQWTNQNPIPNDNDLTSTFFIDDSTGWIVGSEGFIIKTTNTGLDWIQQTSGTTFTLISVKFITSNIGWICGEGGIILKTTDGGQNWYELINSTAEVLTDVFFTDIDTGWVVGYGGTILKTIDGGSSWTDQNSDSSFDLYALYFVNNMVGYAGGVTADDPKFLKTTDGGIDWIDLSSNFPGFGVHYNWISSIKFLDESSGFVGTAIAGGAGSMWETTDGGENWISATFIYPNLSNKSNEKIKGYFEYGLSSIYLDNSNVGYAVNNLTGPWDIEIYTTTDGG